MAAACIELVVAHQWEPLEQASRQHPFAGLGFSASVTYSVIAQVNEVMSRPALIAARAITSRRSV